MITLVELCIIIVFLLLVHETIISRYTHKLKSDLEQQHLLALNYTNNGSSLSDKSKSSSSIVTTTSNIISHIWPERNLIYLDSLPDDIIFQILDNLNQFDVINLSLVNSTMYFYCMHRLFKHIVVYNYDSYGSDQMGICVQPGLHTKFYLDYTIINKPTFLRLMNLDQFQTKRQLIKKVLFYFTDFSPEFKHSLNQMLPYTKFHMYQHYKSPLPYTFNHFQINSMNNFGIDYQRLSDLTELNLNFDPLGDPEANRLIIDGFTSIYGQLKAIKLNNFSTEILDHFKSLKVQFKQVKSLSLNFDIRLCKNLEVLNDIFHLDQIESFEIFLNKSFNVMTLDQLQLHHLNEKLINLKSLNFTTHCQLRYYDYLSSFISPHLSKISINLKYKNAPNHLNPEILFNSGILSLFPNIEILKFNNQLFQHDKFNQKEKYALNSINVFFKTDNNDAQYYSICKEYHKVIYDSRLKYLVMNDCQYVIDRSIGGGICSTIMQ
ncbi:hypothetical protein DFJ63DRAFT_315448 [Scheffersomyces coipomensis]|uniref:uncharacterized protein n=1 Tax=Scheffersomyces coipomensis TaxID=1788519 RepID=UPI00315D3003